MQRTSFCLPVPRWIAAALIAALSWPTTAGVLRCQTADGRTLYQDSSCPHGARGEPVDTTPNRGSRFATEQEIRKAMRPPPEERPRPARSSKTKVRQAVNAGERRFILPGLTAAEVRQRIGAPDQIAHRPSSSGKRRNRDGNQQWIYLPAADDPQTTTALTVKGGVVTHVERKVTR